MKDAIEQFRIELGAAIDSVNFLRGHSTDKYPKMIARRALRDVHI